MRISVGFLYFSGFKSRTFYSRVGAAPEVFIRRLVPAQSENICTRPAVRATDNRAARP